MVGDDLVNDIEGALAAGFAAAVLVIEAGTQAPTDLPLGALVVDDLAAAPAASGI